MTSTTFAASVRVGRAGFGVRVLDGQGPTEMGDPTGRLSVLIPVYNEERTVAEILDRVLALGPVVKEIVVVDDGSKDRTAQIVRDKAEGESKIRFHQLPHNQGKTAAIRKALELATGEIIIIQDADLEYDPSEIPDVIAPILAGVADAVYGSRFLVRKAARVLYFYHYLANTGLTFLSNLLTNRNMSDIETGYKAFRAEVIKPLVLSSKGFGMEVEITALLCKTKARTYEVPISYYGRPYEEGKKIGFMDGVAALWYIAYYNLIKPLMPSGRKYVHAVNEALAKKGIGVAAGH
jgi:glycosyltransferase involved in cell wall biosynthesis